MRRLARLRAAAHRFFRGGGMAGAVYALLSVLLPLRRHVVLIESHKGDGLAGNPHYLLRHLLASPAYDRLRVVVACAPGKEAAVRAFFPDARVRCCRIDSPAYAFHLATARYLVNDVSFPPYFARRDGQSCLNTWHGTPIKALGIGVARTLHTNLRNMQRNFLHATHILFPNAHTETVLRRDFCLDDLWQGTALRCGYPRNDVLARRRGAPRAAGGPLHVAYMPTWRGTHDTLAASSREHIADVAAFLQAFAGVAPGLLVLWVKLHPLMKGALDVSGFANVREFPGDVEPYAHLAGCHALVTDYSSVMIDFAAGGGDVLLYTPDLVQYRQAQAFSIEPDALPFPMFSRAPDVVAALAALAGRPAGTAPGNALLAALLAREDGQAARHVCDAFFRGTGPALPAAGPAPDHGRRVLLLVEERLSGATRAALDSVLAAIHDAGHSAVIATPGERPEDPLLVALAKQGDVTFCPSAASGVSGRWRIPGLPARREAHRLFGPARFALVVAFGDCPYYRRLAAEFPVPARRRVSLASVDAVAALRDAIHRLPGAAGERAPINVPPS